MDLTRLPMCAFESEAAIGDLRLLWCGTFCSGCGGFFPQHRLFVQFV